MPQVMAYRASLFLYSHNFNMGGIFKTSNHSRLINGKWYHINIQ